MKAPVVFVALIVLAGALHASAATSSVTLTASSLTFKQALAACPGALGTVTFSLGHARVAEAAGVSSQSDTTSAGVDTVTFTNDKSQSATVIVNGHDRTVSGKNVQVKWKGQLACVMPE